MSTATKQKTAVTFYAKGTNYLAVRIATEEIRNSRGDLVAVPHSGLKYAFKGGKLTVEDGQDIRPTGPGGEQEDVVTWLRRHPDLGIYFWEVGPKHTDQTPVLLEVAKLAAAGEEEALAELYEREEADEARPDVLGAVSDALSALEKRREAEPEK